jgi:hypothetical protein
MEAKLHVHEVMGQRFTQIAQNYVTGPEELPSLLDVLDMIEATLDNMYIEEKVLESAFQY